MNIIANIKGFAGLGNLSSPTNILGTEADGFRIGYFPISALRQQLNNSIIIPNPANLSQSSVPPVIYHPDASNMFNDCKLCNGSIYFLAGYATGTGGSGVYLTKYNPATEAYTEVGRIGDPLYATINCLAVIGTDLYILVLDAFKKCDCTTDTITDLTYLTDSKYINVYDNNIYCVTSASSVITIYKYLHSTDTWEEKATTATIYSAAGFNETNTQYVKNGVWYFGDEYIYDRIRRKYNFATDTWSAYSDLGSYRTAGKSVFEIDGEFYTITYIQGNRVFGIIDIDTGMFQPKFRLPIDFNSNMSMICYAEGKLYIQEIFCNYSNNIKTPLLIWDISDEILNTNYTTTDINAYFEMPAITPIAANRFVSFSGGYPSEDAKTLGVTQKGVTTGQTIKVITNGVVTIETAGAINVGDGVATDAEGKAKQVLGSEPLNGRAIDSCSSAGQIRIILIN